MSLTDGWILQELCIYNWAHVREEILSHKQTDKQTVPLLIWMMDGHVHCLYKDL